jgi:hypothetical protein
MSYLPLAAIAYFICLYFMVGMAQAETIIGSVLAATVTSVLWIVAMGLLFKGLVQVGTFDLLVEQLEAR